MNALSEDDFRTEQDITESVDVKLSMSLEKEPEIQQVSLVMMKRSPPLDIRNALWFDA